MGNVYTEIRKPSYEKSITSPNYNQPPTFDPNLGFKNGRTTRVMKATEEEIDAAGIVPDQRDYCAHLAIDFKNCYHKKFPFAILCKDIKDAWGDCQFEDYVIRMKEFEREKRLLERAERKGVISEHLAGIK